MDIDDGFSNEEIFSNNKVSSFKKWHWRLKYGKSCIENRLYKLQACFRCAAGGDFVSTGGALWAPGVTLINYKGSNISKYVYPTAIIDIARKITKFVNF